MNADSSESKRMYKLSDASNLTFLIGKEICQVAIGSYDVQFSWGNGGISVWCKFLYKPAGTADEIVWAGEQPESATPTVRLLKSLITSVKCSEEGTLQLSFSNGDQLEIFEDESFSIQDGKGPTIIV
jgi:hypothetical protein